MKRHVLTLLLGAALATAQASAPKIVANPASHVFHVRCTHVETCKKCTVTFTSETEAKDAGYHICPFAKKAVAR